MKSDFLTLYGLSNSDAIIKGMIEDLECYKHDFDLRLILTEALTNAFKHGNNMDEKKPIYLKYEYVKETSYITIKIRDSGNDLKDINITDKITDDMIENTSGRGLFLIQTISDEFYFKENTMVIKKCLN